MKIFYSGVNNSFYDNAIHAGRIPEDAVEISKDQYAALITAQSSGKQIINEGGRPVARDIKKPEVHVILEIAKNELRTMREPMLSAVTGIGWDASVSGDNELVQEARNIRNALRDITDDPALNAAQTYEEMRAAGDDAFRRIASSASEAFSATFKEFK